MVTDFHTHAFPDSLAERAVQTLQQEKYADGAVLDGKASSLLASMDRAGIGRSVICSIATRPDQFANIVTWCRSVASPRLVPLASIHPSDPAAVANVGRVAEAGLKGIKLHPYFQQFVLDDPDLLPFFRELARRQLLVVCHTGFDIGFPRDRICDPARVRNLLDRVPDLRLITTHTGGWQDWFEVRRHLLGRPVYMEISYTLCVLSREEGRDLLQAHAPGYLLFGTDSPWRDQGESLQLLRDLDLPPTLERAILETNASLLLDGEHCRS